MPTSPVHSSDPSPRTWPCIFLLFCACPLLHPLLSSLYNSFSSHHYALCSPHGNHIYTVDQYNTLTQCIVIHNNIIVDIGPLGSITSHWNAKKHFLLPRSLHKNVDIRFIPPGAIVVPGFSDSHAHILEYGSAKELPLGGTRSIAETVARVKEFILANPDVQNDTSKYITGGGWDHTIWNTTRWPTAADFDADPVARGRPIILQSKDYHAIWVSNKALQASLPLPHMVEGGVIVRDEDGNPSGVFLDNAQDLVLQPGPSHSDLMRRFKLTINNALSHGLTSIHDAGLKPDSLAFFKSLADQHALPLRIYGMTYFDENQPDMSSSTPKIINGGNGRLTARSIKIFADGALRTGGAALYEPYTDNPSTSGFMRLEPEVLHDIIPRFLRDGWQVNVHAIGDRANGIVLDAFEAASKDTDVRALRPRLEHAQLMTQADMKRLGELGVIASVQPTHAISDMWYAQDRLGPDRIKGLYAFRSLLDNGARITLGSDFPVETMNPLSAFYAAIARLSLDGRSPHGPDGWFPEQCLTRIEALRGMTIEPAYASFTEHILGSLEIGKRADFVVLSKDIMTIPIHHILSTKILATVLDGKVVYGSL